MKRNLVFRCGTLKITRPRKCGESVFLENKSYKYFVSNEYLCLAKVPILSASEIGVKSYGEWLICSLNPAKLRNFL